MEAESVWTVFQGLGAILAVAITLGLAVVGLVRKRREATRDDLIDMGNLTDFFFDKPSNPRTRTPATKGWTTIVDEKLSEHGTMLVGIQTTLEGVAADAAGARRAAEAEVKAQTTERKRVFERDSQIDD